MFFFRTFQGPRQGGFWKADFCKSVRLSQHWRSERQMYCWAKYPWVLFAVLGVTLDSAETPLVKTPLFLFPSLLVGHTPSTAGTFRKKFRKNSGKTPETLSERFLEFPSRVRLGCPKPYSSRHLRLPERFQNSLPPSTAGDASFFRSGSGEGLSEPVMEFPAVLGAFPNFRIIGLSLI